MKCKRCDQEIEADAPEGVEVCGNCADDLRQEEAEAQANREAYEESERESRIDTGGGWRYI